MGEGLTPGAAFGNIVPAKDSAGNAIVKLFGHMKQGVLAEYAVYQGDTEDPDEATPYLSCYIYSEADYAEQGSEPVKILGKNMLMQVVPTDYQAIGHGNVLERGNCYRNFYWDGKNSAGQPVEEGMYYAVVNAAGAVEGSRMAAVYVKMPVPEETESQEPSEPQEPSKSETEKMTETDQELSLIHI